MLPINISDEEIQVLVNELGCSVGSFPFTYLGLPMGTTRPMIKDLTPIVDRVERKLSANCNFLAYGGRLQLVTSCLQSMSIFFICSLQISPGILKPINRIIRHGFWGKKNGNDYKQSLARWEMISKPKEMVGMELWICKEKMKLYY
jgi:hypothetical protein